jgi:hypothetical protein
MEDRDIKISEEEKKEMIEKIKSRIFEIYRGSTPLNLSNAISAYDLAIKLCKETKDIEMLKEIGITAYAYHEFFNYGCGEEVEFLTDKVDNALAELVPDKAEYSKILKEIKDRAKELRKILWPKKVEL